MAITPGVKAAQFASMSDGRAKIRSAPENIYHE
jgi:hypothetical protein